MTLNYDTLEFMRQNHPAWRLLCSDNVSLVMNFLHRAFITPNVRVIAQADLVEALEDELFTLRERFGPEAFQRPAIDYLNDWASTNRGWLRKFYREGTDEPYFDLMPATEKTIAWLGTLTERAFVGTESRLLTLFELLKQISEGSETDPQARIAELHKRRDEIDAEIARVLKGDISVLDDSALKDRFQQFTQLARELLADFRQVEQNFRSLDRRVRERIAMWDGSKGALVEEIMGERDSISESDQGRSFRAFWDFLMSTRRQEELTALLERVLKLPVIANVQPDLRVRRVHYDWLEAGEHTQRTVADLSKQLRRFLDDQAWLENRRIMDILRGIETKALALRDSHPIDEIMSIADTAADIDLPMERPLHPAAPKPRIADIQPILGEDNIDVTVLFSQITIDKSELARHIYQALQIRSQISLGEICEIQPLQHGLAELVAYLQLASDSFTTVVDENSTDVIMWHGEDASGQRYAKQARLPRVIFVR
jgi:hypothetical protein